MEYKSAQQKFDCFQNNSHLCETKRANSGLGALFRGGLLRVVTRYYARRGHVITRLSVNKRGCTPKYLHSIALFRTNMVVSVRANERLLKKIPEIPRA